MMWKLTKKFPNLSYAHRVYTQKPDTEGKCPCKKLHGHTATVEVSLFSEKIGEDGMLIDLKNEFFVELKDWLYSGFDHVTILSIKDPMVKLLGLKKVVPSVKDIEFGRGWHPTPDEFYPKGKISDTEKEFLDSWTFVLESPTMENLCKVIGEFCVDSLISKDLNWINRIQVTMNETDSNKCSWSSNEIEY